MLQIIFSNILLRLCRVTRYRQKLIIFLLFFKNPSKLCVTISILPLCVFKKAEPISCLSFCVD